MPRTHANSPTSVARGSFTWPSREGCATPSRPARVKVAVELRLSCVLGSQQARRSAGAIVGPTQHKRCLHVESLLAAPTGQGYSRDCPRGGQPCQPRFRLQRPRPSRKSSSPRRSVRSACWTCRCQCPPSTPRDSSPTTTPVSRTISRRSQGWRSTPRPRVGSICRSAASRLAAPAHRRSASRSMTYRSARARATPTPLRWPPTSIPRRSSGSKCCAVRRAPCMAPRAWAGFCAT